MSEHQDFFNSHKPKSTAGIFEHVIDKLPPENEGVAVDLCCGTGMLVSALRARGYRGFGFDISSAFIGRDSDCPDCFALADVIQLPLADNSVDLVTFIDSLQYFDEPDRMIAETSRILKPGGTLLISCQNNYNFAGIKKWLIQSMTGKTWSPWLVHPVENFLFYPDIIRMLEASGYEIEYRRGKQFLTALVSLLPAFIRNYSLWKDKPWRSPAAIAGRTHLPVRIEESFLSRFAMIVFIRARKSG